MATISKTAGTALLTVQSVASNTTVISSILDVSTKLAAFIGIHFGRRSDTALTEGVQIRVEASALSSGDGQWYVVGGPFITQKEAVTHRAITTSSASGQNVLTMTTTSPITADYANATAPIGNKIYIDNTTIGNSEFHTVKAVSANASVTIEDNLVNTQGTSSNVYPSAEFFSCSVDCTDKVRLRVVVAANNTGVACAVDAYAVTGDSIA